MNQKIKEIIKATAPAPVLNYLRQLAKKDLIRKCKSSISLSQAGQDYWVYTEVFNEKKNGFFLDIGAHDGISLSNSFILEKRYGWKGICIEANPKTYTELENNRDCIRIHTCIDKQPGSVEFLIDGVMGGILADDCDNKAANGNQIVNVAAVPLIQVLQQENAPAVIDYLTIDIEGAEDRALLGFDFDSYTFNCITIERPSKELRKVFNDKGYLLIKEIPSLDCFYIHKSFMEQYKKNLFAFGKKKFFTKQWK